MQRYSGNKQGIRDLIAAQVLNTLGRRKAIKGLTLPSIEGVEVAESVENQILEAKPDWKIVGLEACPKVARRMKRNNTKRTLTIRNESDYRYLKAKVATSERFGESIERFDWCWIDWFGSVNVRTEQVVELLLRVLSDRALIYFTVCIDPMIYGNNSTLLSRIVKGYKRKGIKHGVDRYFRDQIRSKGRKLKPMLCQDYSNSDVSKNSMDMLAVGYLIERRAA